MDILLTLWENMFSAIAKTTYSEVPEHVFVELLNGAQYNHSLFIYLLIYLFIFIFYLFIASAYLLVNGDSR